MTSSIQEKNAAEFNDRVRTIKRQIAAGVPKAQIARALGIHRSRLYQILERARERGLL